MTERKSGSPNGIKFQASTRALKLILIVLAALGVGGSSVHFGPKLFNVSGDDKSSHKRDNASGSEFKVRFEVKKIKEVQATVVKDVKTLKTDVKNIKTVQHGAVARGEARGATEKIKDRPKREKAYDRLLLLNLKRLERGDEPCRDLNCSN